MKDIRVPKYLQDLHGKKTSLLILIFTYLSGLVTATVITCFIAKR